jgi:hypothetical protein
MRVPPYPTPTDFFRDTRWKARFEEEVLAAARSFVSKVRNMRLDEPAAASFSLCGNVAAEETEIGFWPVDGGWEFEAFCSCDIGSFCHHAAALMMKAEKEPSRPGGRSVADAVATILPQDAVRENPAPSGIPRISPKPVF